MPSGTIVSLIVIILAQVLPHIGVTFGSDQLTDLVANALTIVLALVAWVRHVSLKKDYLGGNRVNAFGGMKKR